MELTQEYFDKVMANFLDKMATKDDLGDLRLEMATKDDLKSLEARLISYTHQAFETQQTWIDYRFDELVSKYDVRDRVAVLEKEVKELKLKN